MNFNNNLEEGEKNTFWKNYHGKFGVEADLEFLSFGKYLKYENGQIKEGHSFGMKVPVGGVSIGAKISDEGSRFSVGVGKVGLYSGYENGQYVFGIEGKAGPASASGELSLNLIGRKINLY